jgi:hypothetical protein
MTYFALAAAISADVDVKVKVDASLQILGQIKAILLKAKTNVEVAISAGVDLLVLDGKTLAVHAVAQIVAVLVVVCPDSSLTILRLKNVFVGHYYDSRPRCQGLRFS